MSDQFNNNLKNDKVIDIDTKKVQKKIMKFVPITVIAVVLFLLLVNSFYMLESGENGVIMRFGKVSNVVTVPGPHFKIPFVDDLTKVDIKRIYNMEYGYRTTGSGTETTSPTYTDVSDETEIIVDAANGNASIALIELIIQYKISDPTAYLFNVDDVEGTLRLALEDTVRTSVQSFTLDEAKTNKGSIDAVIKPELQKKMNDYESGIEIILVSTQNVNFLASVETAYQQKENANQYKNSKQEDAERYYNTVIPQANAEATQLVERANAYKAETIASANAAVAEFNALYAEYIKNPQILKEKYYIEAMSNFLINNKIVVDATGNGDIYKFYNFNENDLVKEQITSEQTSSESN